MVDRVDIQGVLEQMRALKGQTSIPNTTVNPTGFSNAIEQARQQMGTASPSRVNEVNEHPDSVVSNTPTGDVPSFGQMMGAAINTVNHNQQVANNLATRYEMGDPKVDLPEVMIALQKSSVSFQAMTQVRNKMVEAYKEIINMTL
ncbi:flagellar hook-basal body complex protein FliE [Reinekea thalattae]|uniref:Flagellar hook-basal body complex protein FliE n=1 Tax=Reinekea thalattae TaxID=2593301 RepID=A0A5C8Z608_9GAMM|nr:flagellar hook-basal body complex protein FliE [Reinekea thalattae]TXR53402.1 flagellar hook-basal body complex protein FliE [Reinekea thalattae]